MNDDMIMPVGGGGRLVIKKVRRVPGNKKERYAVALELGDLTTVDQVTRAARKAMAWRDGLIRQQGMWFHGNFEEFLGRIDSLHAAPGRSYAELAHMLNATISRCIELSLSDGLPEPHEDLLLVRDTPGWNHDWVTRAKMVLRVFLPVEDADKALAGALKRVERGDKAFPLDPPIGADAVREKIRYFRRRQKENSPPRR